MLPLRGSISRIGKIVVARSWADDDDQRANLSLSFFDGAWLGGVHEVLELGEEPLNGSRSGAIMLEQLGEKPAADAFLAVIEKLLVEGGQRTGDMGGQGGTVDVDRAIDEPTLLDFLTLHHSLPQGGSAISGAYGAQLAGEASRRVNVGFCPRCSQC